MNPFANELLERSIIVLNEHRFFSSPVQVPGKIVSSAQWYDGKGCLHWIDVKVPKFRYNPNYSSITSTNDCHGFLPFLVQTFQFFKAIGFVLPHVDEVNIDELNVLFIGDGDFKGYSIYLS